MLDLQVTTRNQDKKPNVNKIVAAANAGVDYIVISPEDLEDVLAGKNIRFRKNKNVNFDYIF